MLIRIDHKVTPRKKQSLESRLSRLQLRARLSAETGPSDRSHKPTIASDRTRSPPTNRRYPLRAVAHKY